MEIHAGIVLVLHGSLPRDGQWALLLRTTALIEQEVLEGRSMVNRVLEMEENGDGQFYELPPP